MPHTLPGLDALLAAALVTTRRLAARARAEYEQAGSADETAALYSLAVWAELGELALEAASGDEEAKERFRAIIGRT